MENIDIGSIGDGGCACGEVKGHGYRISVHCHKSNGSEGCRPHVPCVEYSQDKGLEHAEKIRRYVAESWYGWNEEEHPEPNVFIHKMV